jgi:hypothetical protein
MSSIINKKSQYTIDSHNKFSIGMDNTKTKTKNKNKSRGSQDPVIAHLVFNLTSKVDRKWGRYT